MSGVIKDIRTEYVEDALLYVIIPAYEVALPVTHTIRDTLATFLVSRGDYKTSCEMDSLPQVSRKVLLAHFPTYEILPVLRTIEKIRPSATLSPTERETRSAGKRVAYANDQRTKRETEKRAWLAENTLHVSLNDL